MNVRRTGQLLSLLSFTSTEQQHLPYSRLDRQGQGWCWCLLKKGIWREEDKDDSFTQGRWASQARPLVSTALASILSDPDKTLG